MVKRAEKAPQIHLHRYKPIGILHLCKNASSSMKKAFYASMEETDRFQVFGLAEARRVKESGIELAAIIRDPVKRLVSAWRYFGIGGRDIPPGMPDPLMPINMWVNEILEADPRYLDQHIKPQGLLIGDDIGQIPEHLLFHERLVWDWTALGAIWKMKYDFDLQPLPHLGASVDRIGQTMLTEDTEAAIRYWHYTFWPGNQAGRV